MNNSEITHSQEILRSGVRAPSEATTAFVIQLAEWRTFIFCERNNTLDAPPSKDGYIWKYQIKHAHCISAPESLYIDIFDTHT